MLTPREIVFRLNAGGDLSPEGATELVGAVDVVLPGAGTTPPVAGGVVVPVVVLLGETSGENTAPSAYSDRLRP